MLAWQSPLASPRSLSLRRRWLRTLRRRHGGYVKPPASGRMKGGGRPTPATATTAPTSSSLLRGDPQVHAAYRQTLLRLSKPTGRGSSGNAMAEAGANGAPPEPAGSEKCFVPFPHRHFNRYGETVVCPSLARVVWPDGVSRFYDPGPDAA